MFFLPARACLSVIHLLPLAPHLSQNHCLLYSVVSALHRGHFMLLPALFRIVLLVASFVLPIAFLYKNSLLLVWAGVRLDLLVGCQSSLSLSSSSCIPPVFLRNSFIALLYSFAAWFWCHAIFSRCFIAFFMFVRCCIYGFVLYILFVYGL